MCIFLSLLGSYLRLPYAGSVPVGYRTREAVNVHLTAHRMAERLWSCIACNAVRSGMG
jgi:hypothetical protein